jgi:hypothetical protein
MEAVASSGAAAIGAAAIGAASAGPATVASASPVVPASAVVPVSPDAAASGAPPASTASPASMPLPAPASIGVGIATPSRSVRVTSAALGRSSGSIAVIACSSSGHGCGRPAGIWGERSSRASTASSAGPS